MVKLIFPATHISNHSIVEGIDFRTDGYCPLQQILAHKSVAQHKATLGDICSAVATNAKKRFALKLMQEDQTLKELDDAFVTSAAIGAVNMKLLYIAAVQGHSIDVPELDLKLVATIADLPEKSVVVHGTKKQFWQSIKDTVRAHMNISLLDLHLLLQFY